MARKISDQYNEIFKYVGEKFTLYKLNYAHYQRLHKDDVRKKLFDKFLNENLPIENSKDEEFKDKINELNNNPTLKKEDKITDSESFFKLGEKLFAKKDNKAKKAKPIRYEKGDDMPKTSIMAVAKGIYKNIPKGALLASSVSIAAFIGTRMLGAYAGWPMAAMLATANVTLLIPHAVILSYCGIRFFVNRVKDGSFKNWIQKIKNKRIEKRIQKSDSKVEIKTKEKNEPLPSFDRTSEEFAPLPDDYKKVTPTEIPPVPVFEKPVKNEINDEKIQEEPMSIAAEDENVIESEFVDNKSPLMLQSGEGIDYSAYDTTNGRRMGKENPILENKTPIVTPIVEEKTNSTLENKTQIVMSSLENEFDDGMDYYGNKVYDNKYRDTKFDENPINNEEYDIYGNVVSQPVKPKINTNYDENPINNIEYDMYGNSIYFARNDNEKTVVGKHNSGVVEEENKNHIAKNKQNGKTIKELKRLRQKFVEKKDMETVKKIDEILKTNAKVYGHTTTINEKNKQLEELKNDLIRQKLELENIIEKDNSKGK